jgi:hypothetical protein
MHPRHGCTPFTRLLRASTLQRVPPRSEHVELHGEESNQSKSIHQVANTEGNQAGTHSCQNLSAVQILHRGVSSILGPRR